MKSVKFWWYPLGQEETHALSIRNNPAEQLLQVDSDAGHDTQLSTAQSADLVEVVWFLPAMLRLQC